MLSALLPLCCALSASDPGPSASPVLLFVSPTGDDRAPGTEARPFATPGRARDEARTLLASGAAEEGVRITFAAGEYVLSDTLTLTPADSGKKDHAPVVYGAAPDARVVFSGGRRLGPWRTATFEGREVWATDVPAARESVPPAERWEFRELYVGGTRRTLARHPDAGFLTLQDVPDVPAGTPWNKGLDRLRFREKDASVWSRVTPGTEIVTFMRWVDDHRVIASVDTQARVARTTCPAIFLNDPGDPYYLENSSSFLDSPGEWWLDPKAGVVYYMPLPGERIESQDAIAPRLGTLLALAGEPENPVHDVHFRGIRLAHAHWWFPDDFALPGVPADVHGFQQAAWGVPAAVRLEYSRDVLFESCSVAHVSGYGVELGRGCRDNALSRCTITDLGAGGVKIGTTSIAQAESDKTAGNLITDCTITDGGRIHRQAIGVWIGQSSGNVLRHNRISGLDYSGISIGWTWGYGPSDAGGNIVEFNEIANLGHRDGQEHSPLGDMAGIYTLGAQKGTIIRDNFFHDIAGRSIAWGIYFDEGSAGIVAERNVVLRTTHGGFHQHYGRDNIVRENIFCYGRDAQLWKTRREDHTCFTFTRNVVLCDNDRFMAGDWAGSDVVLSDNLYWREDGVPPVFPGNLTLEQWQATGKDAGSKIADPMFADPRRADFGLKEGSPLNGRALPDVGQTGPRN
jgi:hypothetical protein